MLAPIGEKDEVLEVGFGAGFGFARRVGVAGGAEDGSLLSPLGATEGLEEAEGVDLIIASVISVSIKREVLSFRLGACPDRPRTPEVLATQFPNSDMNQANVSGHGDVLVKSSQNDF